MYNIASRVIEFFLHWAIDFSVNQFLICIQMTYKLLFLESRIFLIYTIKLFLSLYTYACMLRLLF